MTAIAYYLLKVMICSGLLFLYYQLALKNKIFHQWNRFYLLFAAVLSVLLPLLQFTLWHSPQQDNGAVNFALLVQSADDYLEAITIRSTPAVSPEQWVLMAYGLTCCFLLGSFLVSLFKIRKIIQANSIQFIDGIRFVNTREPGSPFSFLCYIFWNEKISLQTDTGRQIFQHEMVHVKQKHTLDKLFMQSLLVFYWCNPFFWLMRRELKLIHEFIADEKAVQQHGTEAFAAMVLQAAYPQHYHSITNQFFQTSIKRRLVMLTKIKNPNVAYASRLLALPLIALTAFAFTVRAKPLPEAGKSESLPAVRPGVERPSVLPGAKDTIPQKKISSVNVQKDDSKKTSRLTITYTDGTSVTLTEPEAVKRGLLKSPDRDSERSATGYSKARNEGVKPGVPDPLYILDGKEITKTEMHQLNPASIEAVHVLKGLTATQKYGNKGANGVVEIQRKEGKLDGKASGQNEVVEAGQPAQKTPDNVQDGTEKIFTQTETPASVDKGEWRQFLSKNLQPVIENAASKGMKPGSYTVNVRFLVKKDGSLSGFQALNDPGYDLAKRLLAIMPNSPDWKPAEQNGKPVTSYHTQPVTFVIQQQ